MWSGQTCARTAILGVVFTLIAFVASYAESPSPVTDPTFMRDVLPILQGHCQTCHRPGQIAPMSFASYEEVRPWAKSIAKVVHNRTMPPFHAAGPLNLFQNDPRLTEEQIAIIIEWVRLGSPRGDVQDAPPARVWPDSEWEMKDPDLVLNFATHTLSAEDTDEFIFFFSDYVFNQDTWIQEIEFRTSNYRIVHHAGIIAINDTFETPEGRTASSEQISEDDYRALSIASVSQNVLFTWLPGQRAHSWPTGQGRKIARGESPTVEVHIQPMLEPATCDVSVAFKFVDGMLTESTHLMVSMMTELVVPPGVESYILHQFGQLPFDAMVSGYWMHMHTRGKSTSVKFHYPRTGKTETLLDIPQWDFNWQRSYMLTEPIAVEEGTRVEFTAEWDNSVNNPLNPDPTQTVKWGAKTNDEMFGGIMYYTRKLKEPIIVRDGLEVIGPQEFQR